jgi:hypothetical protein
MIFDRQKGIFVECTKKYASLSKRGDITIDVLFDFQKGSRLRVAAF